MGDGSGGGDGDGGGKSKKQRSRTTVGRNCDDKVELCSNLAMAQSSMLHTHHRTKEDTGSNKEGVSSFRGKKIR